MIVASQSRKVPHFVCSSSHGQYCCRYAPTLLQWLKWMVISMHSCSGTSVLSITSVAMSGLPSGRGHKGVPKRKRNTRRHSQRWWYIVLQLCQFCLPQFPIYHLHPVQYALYSGQCISAHVHDNPVVVGPHFKHFQLKLVVAAVHLEWFKLQHPYLVPVVMGRYLRCLKLHLCLLLYLGWLVKLVTVGLHPADNPSVCSMS